MFDGFRLPDPARRATLGQWPGIQQTYVGKQPDAHHRHWPAGLVLSSDSKPGSSVCRERLAKPLSTFSYLINITMHALMAVLFTKLCCVKQESVDVF